MTTTQHQLRDYQQTAVERTIAAMDRRPVLVAPTGSGKTTMATAMVQTLDMPTLWLAHRKELIEQASERLEAHGLRTGIVMAGVKPDPDAQVQVASVQTLVRRPRNRPNAGLIVVDESHHATADTYRAILDAYPDAHLVGLTATPFRLDGRGLGDLFGELIVAAYPDELCDTGVLHAPKVWASVAPDLKGVRVVGGDYNLGQLAQRTNTVQINGDIVETWLKRAPGMRTVAFAVDVAHSKAIVDAFVAAGVQAEHLDGATPRDERSAVLERLASGQTQVVSNCMVLTEGWDLPALQCAILARPTASLNLHLQTIGRIMRVCDGKDSAIVLDHAGNHHLHGLVTRRIEYSLDDAVKVKHTEPLNLRRCEKCGLLYEPAKVRCPECGWINMPKPRPPAPIRGEGELVAFNDHDFAYRRQAWDTIEAERKAMGYRPGWSLYRFEDRFGVKPLVLGGELVDPAAATQAQKRSHYEYLVEVGIAKGYKPGWASVKFKEMFGHWPRGFVDDVREGQLRDRLGLFTSGGAR